MSPVTPCPACGRSLRVESRSDRTLIPCAGCGIVVTAVQTPQGLRLLLPPGHRMASKPSAASTSTPSISVGNKSAPTTPPIPIVARPIATQPRATTKSTTQPILAARPLQIIRAWLAHLGRPAWIGLAAVVMLLAAVAYWWPGRQSNSTMPVAVAPVPKEQPRDAGSSKPAVEIPLDPVVKPDPVSAETTPPSAPPPPPPAVDPPSVPTPTTRVALSTRELIRLVEPSVCRIRARNSVGSGFVVGSHLVCTNEHVLGLEDEAGWLVEFPARDGRMFRRVTLAYATEGVDLALLRVADLPGDFRSLPIIGRAELQKGERLVVIGSPGGMENVVTEGIIGSFLELNRKTFVQLSVTVNPGNSGGPALNEFGDVAGVVTLKAEQEGIGMAIPGDEVQRALRELAGFSTDEAQRLQARWKARQAGTKLLVGSREALALLTSPSGDPQEVTRNLDAWQNTYRDGPDMSRRLRTTLLDADKRGLFERLEQLFNEAKALMDRPASDPAALQSHCDRLTAQADALQGELKTAYGLAETSRRKEARIGRDK